MKSSQVIVAAGFAQWLLPVLSIDQKRQQGKVAGVLSPARPPYPAALLCDDVRRDLLTIPRGSRGASSWTGSIRPTLALLAGGMDASFASAYALSHHFLWTQ